MSLSNPASLIAIQVYSPPSSPTIDSNSNVDPLATAASLLRTDLTFNGGAIEDNGFLPLNH